MRVARDEGGKLCFTPEEWRTAKQIASYFSRLAATQVSKKHPLKYLLNKPKPSVKKTIKHGKEKESCKNYRQRCTKTSTCGIQLNAMAMISVTLQSVAC